MNPREQKLAVVLIAAIGLTVAAAGGYFFVWQPLSRQRTAEDAVTAEIADLEDQLTAQQKTAQKLAQARARSLPADETLARREYTVALERMLEGAGVPKGYTITRKNVDNSVRSVPEITKGKLVYTRVAYDVTFKKADMWAVMNFLQRYYQFGLLHQITALSIKKDDDANAKNAGRRNDLTVTLTTEAVIVEGAENRKTLLAVPTAFAALGGGAMFQAIALNTEYARGVAPQAGATVLAPGPRDYTILVRNDPFNGPYKDPVISAPDPFKLSSIKDVKIKPDEKPDPVKVYVKGTGSTGAKVTAIAAGTLFAEGALPVDPKTNAIELPKTSATEGTATISVIATSADGAKTEKTSFKVSVEEEVKSSGPEKPDVSFAIILIGSTPRSDGTAWARVKDNANRLRYNIEAGPKGVTVVKEWFVLDWKKDRDYDHPDGQLVISDETSKTHRTFKVIAVDGDGLIVADLKPDGHAPDKPKGPGKGWPGGPGGGWPPKPGAAPKQGHANPLTALGGNMIAAVAQPKFYRWPVGQPLSALKLLTEDEAKKVLKVAAESGPVVDVTAIVK